LPPLCNRHRWHHHTVASQQHRVDLSCPQKLSIPNLTDAVVTILFNYSRGWRPKLDDGMSSSSNFESFRKSRLEIKVHELRCLYGETPPRSAWRFHFILVVDWCTSWWRWEYGAGGNDRQFPGSFCPLSESNTYAPKRCVFLCMCDVKTGN
jgi:hypothetical protein